MELVERRRTALPFVFQIIQETSGVLKITLKNKYKEEIRVNEEVRISYSSAFCDCNNGIQNSLAAPNGHRGNHTSHTPNAITAGQR